MSQRSSARALGATEPGYASELCAPLQSITQSACRV